MAMMTTLDGRLDDPGAWVRSIPDDLYAELDRQYEGYDTILVGRTTYLEMAEYWPGAGSAPETPDAGRRMAEKMNGYRKLVFTGATERPAPEWNNAEWAPVAGDDDITALVTQLKAQPGGAIHLAGGARLARTMVRLDLVDRFHLVTHPIATRGSAWFADLGEPRDLRLLGAAAYSNGAVGLQYEAVRG